MEDNLLEVARRQAEKADPSIRAVALLWIARAESAGDASQAQRTLVEALNALQELPSRERQRLMDEARRVAAAVSPELLNAIPDINPPVLRRFATSNLVQTMIAHGHIDAAFNFLLDHDDPASFSILPVGALLPRLDPHRPGCDNRRLILLRRALEVWRQSPSDGNPLERDQFVRVFGQQWKEFPAEEASAVVRMVIARAMTEPDTETPARYTNDIHFSSRRQGTLFQILHVLRHLDPALAQSLVDSHDQLAAAARRYPNGLETIKEEAETEAERQRKLDGATGCGTIFTVAGDATDFDRQRRLVEANQNGHFAQSIEVALEKYREDTSPATRNNAPKEYWPSTGACRTVFYEAGKRLGSEAATLLKLIPDDDLRLFASIELAAGIAGVPRATITEVRPSNLLRSSHA